jgi:aminoglycoside 6'-N-acetyltransferase I
MKKDNSDKYFFTDEEFFDGVEEQHIEIKEKKEPLPTYDPTPSETPRDGFFIVAPGDESFLDAAAELLTDVYPGYAERPDDAYAEIERVMTEDAVFIVRVVEGELIGLIGARLTHGDTGYELFPHAVHPDEQNQGLGTVLLYMLEQELARRGATVLFLAVEDEFGDTTLHDKDLFEDAFVQIREMKAVNWHPFVFYRRRGFQVYGVIPDAFGIGKPDILMAKKIAPAGI